MKRENRFKIITAILAVLCVLIIVINVILTNRKNKAKSDSDEDMSINEMEDRNINEVDNADLKGEHYPQSVAEFGIEMLKSIEIRDENLFESPISLHMAMAMTGNGAANETLNQLGQALGKDLTQNQINAYVSDLLNEITEDDYLKISNSLWINNKKLDHGEMDESLIKKRFIDVNTQNYNAEIFLRPFHENTLKDINNWISEKSDGFIKKALNEIDDQSMMFLINTILFDATWETTFEELATEKKIFTDNQGNQQETDFMYGIEKIMIQDDEAIGILKPYSGGKYSFAAILPEESTNLNDYINSIDGRKFMKLLNSQSDINIEIEIPKFTHESDLHLKQSLIHMGISDAFDERKADFSNITDVFPLYIDEVVHKTFIEVNEEGTKAGGASVVGVNRLTAVLPEKMLKFNRPFLYAIIDNETKIPFFLGLYHKP